MDLNELLAVTNLADAGAELHSLVKRLYPFPRSITGNGLRATLALLQSFLPALEVHEVPTGTQVLDWTIPKEWNVADAYLKNTRGERVVDFANSNLHVVAYSTPVAITASLAELRPRLHTLPDRPDWIPYRTSYYREDWGLCMSHKALTALEEGTYELRIDAAFTDGSLTYGELFVPGVTDDEVLLSAHTCHPSLCNDNLSGISIATFIARYVSALRARGTPCRYGYRFVFAPATIGALAWLARNPDAAARVRHGLVLTLLGDPGHSTYKRSRRGNAPIDRAAAHVLAHSGQPHHLQDFTPYGYDERQYCSPGFDLPMGCLMRTPYAKFPEYHTSADDPSFVKPASLEDSLSKCLDMLHVLENDASYLNLNPRGEPQLGRRGIYRALAERTATGQDDRATKEFAMLWVLNQSDGTRSLLDIAERSNIPFSSIEGAAKVLCEHSLLRKI